MRLARFQPNPQSASIDLVAPGNRGLNLQQQSGVLPPVFCTEAQNAIIDNNGRLAARDGFTNVTATPITSNPSVRSIFEHRRADASTATIIAWNGGISSSVSSPEANDISGAVVDANGRWKFVNFNDKAIGFQSGQKLIVRTTGNFANVVESSGTAPTGGVGTAAYGRIWQVDSDGKTIKYSGLLDETAWSSGGAGEIDMSEIWTIGTDVIRAIAAFNHQLVVFGARHIVFFSDGGTGVLGLDPTLLFVSDIIAGTGTLSQHTLQPVGDTDLLFASDTGVQSLKRLIIQKSNPVISLTKLVRDELVADLVSETADNISSVYSATNGFYLLTLPTSSVTWVLDQRRRYQDEDGDEVCATTRWNTAATATYELNSRTLYFARTAGKVATYSGPDDEGTPFRFIWQSPWLDLGEQVANRLKLLKRLGAIIFARVSMDVVFKWAVDFQISGRTKTVTIDPSGGSSEFGIAEFGIAEFSGGTLLQILTLPARAKGQYYRLSIEADVSGEFAIQQAELFAKIGRVA